MLNVYSSEHSIWQHYLPIYLCYWFRVTDVGLCCKILKGWLPELP